MPDLLKEDNQEKEVEEEEFALEELKDLKELKQLVKQEEESARKGGMWGSV